MRIVLRHYGPGLHPKSGTSQLAHSHPSALAVPRAPVVVNGKKQLPGALSDKILSDEFGDWWSKRSDREKEILGDYAAFKYNTLNKGLRGFAEYQGKFDPAEVKLLDDTLDSHTLTKDVIVYRGIDGIPLKDVKVGGHLTDLGYTSTSLLHSVTAEGTEFARGNVLQMVIPKGTKCGVVVRPGSGVEAEILLPRGARFEVVSMGKAQGRNYVVLKLVDFSGKQSVESLPAKKTETKKQHTPQEDEWSDPRYYDF